MLIFNVRNQNISRIDNFSPAEKSENYLEALFNFKTDDWKDCTKTATFENSKSKVIKDVILSNDKCLVPWEVLEEKATIKVSVYGINLSEKITTDMAEFSLNSTVSGGSATTEPTPDVYQQIIAMLDDIDQNGVTDEQIERAVENYLSENPIGGVDETEVQRIVADYISANKEDLKGDKGDKGDKGEPGNNGINGADGYTPIKGIDYWTEEDIAYIKAYIDKQIEDALSSSTPSPEPDEPIVPDEPEEPTLEVPQTGTWQLKTTSDKKYVIFGTDDDNEGNPKFFRMLRTYGFPYTMNVEAETARVSRSLGSDVDDNIFDSSDAPALFADGVNVVDLGTYLYESNSGEVAQHGSSLYTLWDSDRLTGTFLDNLHADYTSNGGTKSKEELRAAIMEQLASTDVAQGASYVIDSRDELESIYNFPIYTVGIWGGSPIATIDGIECDLNSIKSGNYNWRADNYTAVALRIGNYKKNTSTFDLSRNTIGVDSVKSYVEEIKPGSAFEFFWHMPFHDEPDISKWRDMFSYVKSLVDAGVAEVVTRKQYAELGEYVDNPVVSISATRDGKIAVGETDDLSKYTVVATYQDGTTADVSDEAFVDNRHVVTTEPSNFDVYITYRGIDTIITVVVDDLENSNYVDYTFYDTVGLSKTNVVETSVKGVYVFPIEPGQTYYLNSSGKKGNHIIGYSDEAVPVKLAATTDGAQLGSWVAMTNKEITNPSGKSYLYYYYSGSDSTDVTLSKTAV